MALPSLKGSVLLSRFDDARDKHLSELIGSTYVVIELLRYYPEPSFRQQCGLDNSHFWDVFDITLSDRQQKRKFILTAEARFKQKILPGCLGRVKKCALRWNEKHVDREAMIIIQELEVVDDQTVDIRGLQNLPWTPNHYTRQTENVPLASSRCYYVDNWTFGVATEKLNLGHIQSCSASTIDLTSVCCLKDVVAKKGSQCKNPTILVKVMRKSRLIHYITSYKEDKWPFQLPLTVADQSGWCAAVIWNKLAIQCLDQIQEGSILLLSNFRVKKSVQQTLKSFFSPPPDAEIFQCELSLNGDRPVTDLKIVKVESNDDVDQFDLPTLETCWMSRKDLILVPDLSVVDVAGIVTFVGRVEREPKKAAGQLVDSGGFFYCRWVHVRDVSLDDPIVILVYAGDQRETFLNLKPGQYLLCRHLLSNQQLSDLRSSRQIRYGWLTTTANSWLYVIDPANAKTLPEPLEEILTQSLPKCPTRCKDVFLQGGVFRFPPFLTSLESLKKSDSNFLEKIVQSTKWKSVFDRMTWQECHQLVLYASLISFKYVKAGKGTQTTRRHSRKRCANDDESTNAGASQTGDPLHLGLSQPELITPLWPTKSEKKPERKSSLLFSWQGLNSQDIIHTVKPCAWREGATEIENFTDVLCGMYDSHLGLVQCDRSELTSEEVEALTEAAQSYLNHNFLLLVDVYTNNDNQQLVTLNRAFLMT